MKFLDLKLFLIIFLLIVVYFLYKEINSIKRHLNLLIESKTNEELFHNNLENEPIKILKTTCPIDLRFFENILPFRNKVNIVNECEILEEDYDDDDEILDCEIIDDKLVECKIINSKDLEENDIEIKIENQKNNVENQKNNVENQKNDVIIKDIEIKIENQKNDIVNQKTDVVNQKTDIIIEKRIIDIDTESNEDDIEDYMLDNENLEVYSNDTEKKSEEIKLESEETKLESEETKLDSVDDKLTETITVGSLNRKKLPELQDIALKHGIKLSNENNKKKTKNELINDIKLFI
jgi:hypothetical protein